jgi:D-alanine--poly(phosphoribitol) ligase subunit 2
MELVANKLTDELCEFVRGQLLTQRVEEFTPASALREFGLDSFALIELLLFAENNFGIHVPDTELTSDNLRSVEAFAQCLLRNR